jgi:hypothetical protein
MRIEGNNGIARVGGTQAPTQSKDPQKTEHALVDLAKASTLETALKASPEMRTEQVERAKALIADASYPSAEVINHVAKVLAGGIRGPE